MHYWRHLYTVCMVYLGLEIVIAVYCRKFPLDILRLVDIYLTKHRCIFNRLVISRVMLAKAGTNEL